MASARRHQIVQWLVAYVLATYLLTLSYAVYQYATEGFVFYDPRVDLFQMILAPLLLPSLLLYAFGNWLSGYLPTLRFLGMLGAVAGAWLASYGIIRCSISIYRRLF